LLVVKKRSKPVVLALLASFVVALLADLVSIPYYGAGRYSSAWYVAIFLLIPVFLCAYFYYRFYVSNGTNT
jgi:hypothetical protein